MMVKTVALALVSTVALSTVGVAPAPYRTELQAAVDELRDLGVAGAQAEVSAGHRHTVARAGVADRATGAPMPSGGHFRIGSTTKTFVSVVVLQLAGEGRLGLDDPVERWLPGVVAGNGNDGRRITVRNLLQHTSGVYNYTRDLPALASAEGYLAHRYDHYELADLAAIALRHPPGFAPGTRWDYSNTNYVLAAMVIERVTGHGWADQVRSRILNPLGLRDTSYPADRTLPARPFARSYQEFGPGEPLDVTAFNSTVAGPAGGMVSTTGDIARFWRALQRGELLRPRQFAEMHRTVLAETFQDVIPGLRYGLGIFSVPNGCGGYWGHPGDVPGTSTFNGVTPAGDRAVVLYRTTGFAAGATGKAADDVAAHLVDRVLCG